MGDKIINITDNFYERRYTIDIVFQKNMMKKIINK